MPSSESGVARYGSAASRTTWYSLSWVNVVATNSLAVRVVEGVVDGLRA